MELQSGKSQKIFVAQNETGKYTLTSLGSVDISTKPNQGADKTQRAQVVL
jgi:hypothetical protein